MSCESSLTSISESCLATKGYTIQASSTLVGINTKLVTLISLLSASDSSEPSLSEDYLHDLVILMSSMHQNVLGNLPSGLKTVSVGS